MKFTFKYKVDVKDGLNEQQIATNTATRLRHENTEKKFDTFYFLYLQKKALVLKYMSSKTYTKQVLNTLYIIFLISKAFFCILFWQI